MSTSTGWVRQCVELPGMSLGWLLELSGSHITMRYSMTQESQVPWQSGPIEGKHPGNKHIGYCGRSLLSYRTGHGSPEPMNYCS